MPDKDAKSSIYGGITREPFEFSEERQSLIDEYESSGYLDSAKFYRDLEGLVNEESTLIDPDITLDGVSPVEPDNVAKTETGKEISVRYESEKWRIVYGDVRVSGILSFITTDVSSSGEWLHIFQTVAAHEIEGIDEVFFDNDRFEWQYQETGTEIGDGQAGFGDWAFPGTVTPQVYYAYANVFTQSRGHPNQEANPSLVSQSAALFPGKWTSSNRQRNRAGVYIILYYDSERYPNGFPKILQHIRGRKCYDPRLDSSRSGTGTHRYDNEDTWEFSNNAALVIANYLMTPKSTSYGMGVNYDTSIDETALISASDICDEKVLVDLTRRYTTPSTNVEVNGSSQTGDTLCTRFWGNEILCVQTGHWLKFGTEYYRIVKSSYSSDAGIAYIKFDRNLVASPSDGTDLEIYESRYHIDGVFDSSQDHQQVLQSFAQNIAGYITNVNGKWFIRPGDWVAPTLELTIDDFLTTIDISTKLRSGELFNSIKGACINPDANWDETEYPYVSNLSYVTEDGVQRWEERSFPFVISTAYAQRLCKIYLEKNRQGLTVESTFGIRAYQLRVGDTVQLTLEKYGWSQKEFEVKTTSLATSSSGGVPSLGVNLKLQETASGIYDWANGEETSIDLAPNTDLPSPSTVINLTNLALESGNAQMYARKDGTIFSAIKVSWDLPNDPISKSGKTEIQYKKSTDSNWQDSMIVGSGQSTTRILDIEEGVNYDVRARTISLLGVVNPVWVEYLGFHAEGKTEPPSDVSSITGTVTKYGIEIDWTAIADIDLRYYELRFGATWATSDIIASNIQATNYTWAIRNAGTYNILVKAIDTSNNASDNATNVSVVISNPNSVVVSSAIERESLVLSWNELTPTDFAIADYEISYGSVFASATLIEYIKGNIHTLNVTWGGNRKFWVRARDVAGNFSTENSHDVSINIPGQVNSLRSEVVDNNAMLYWLAPTTLQLPIKSYRIYKGATFATSTLLGETLGTFKTIIELEAGEKIYWVTAIDSAGNEGTEKSLPVLLSNPPDFKLHNEAFIDPNDADTFTYANVLDDRTYLAPIITGETWGQHFINNSWTTIQNQIDAGYPIFAQPSSTNTSVFEEKIDLGVILSSSMVFFTFQEKVIDGGVTVNRYISSSVDDVTYTTPSNVSQLLASNFRYLKLKIEVSGTDQTSLVEISDIKYSVSTKTQSESGMVSAVSTDVGGTQVNFDLDFLVVNAINLTAIGTTLLTAVCDFTSIPDPVGFKVLLFDSAGARASGNVSWNANGSLNI